MAGLPQPNDQFTGSSDPILIGVEVRCEDSFDDFGAASSEIDTLLNEVIELLGNPWRR